MLQANLYAQQAQSADSVGTADALSAAAQAALDVRYGLAPPSAGLTVHANAVTVDFTGSVGRDTSITVGADGLPVISYYDATNMDLKVAHLFFKPLGRR